MAIVFNGFLCNSFTYNGLFMLFVSIPGPTLASAADAIQMSGEANGVELRLDLFQSLDLTAIHELMQKSTLPVMLTLRRKDQGGGFSGTEEKRLDLLEQLCALQPAYVDLEWDISPAYRKKLFEKFPSIQFLSSYHDFERTPDLEALLNKMRTPHTHYYKIATTAQSTLDALRMLLFIQEKKRLGVAMIGMSMGERGVVTRILGPIFGNAWTYATLNAEAKTASGQLTLDSLLHIYRYRALNPGTAIYALIGDPVDKSAGHIVHNAVMEKLKIDAVYVKMVLDKEELAPFFSFVKSMPFEGLSVTMPLKEAVLPFLDEQEEDVKTIGSSNTLLLKKGRALGFNTDGKGALDAIEAKGKVKGKRLVVLGSGGTAKAIVFEALRRGANVCVINRSAEKAKELAHALGCQGGGVDLLPKTYDLLINCTPEAFLSSIIPGSLVMDCVYVPKNTPFLLAAAAQGCSLVYGCEMFINQAVAQCLIWYGKKYNQILIKETIEKKTEDHIQSF
jgi:3-dehydroquinate dehydratase/shikimate dehydrogenase